MCVCVSVCGGGGGGRMYRLESQKLSGSFVRIVQLVRFKECRLLQLPKLFGSSLRCM